MLATRQAEIPRTIFTDEHVLLRDTARRFCEREIAPYHDDWERAGQVSREVWRKAGDAGLLCMSLPEEYGGADADFRSSTVLIEELAKINATGPGFSLQSDIVAPYILHYGSEEQKRTWLPRLASGETITAIAMTEPGTGSDLQSITTRAERRGDGYAITGAKTFVTNGVLADLIVVVPRPARAAPRYFSWSATRPALRGRRRSRSSVCTRKTRPSSPWTTSTCPRARCSASPAWASRC
jgi:acyl-CoA dehydrogenase